MKREQAIKELTELLPEEFLSEYAEAIRMAIKALEQQDKVLDAIKEIRDLLKQPAAYVPNYDAYGLCLSIICKHMEVEG